MRCHSEASSMVSTIADSLDTVHEGTLVVLTELGKVRRSSL